MDLFATFPGGDVSASYFNLTSRSGTRPIDYIIASDLQIPQRLITKTNQPVPVNDWSVAQIDFNEGHPFAVNYMKPVTHEPGHRMMLRLSSFTAAHSVQNISDDLWMRNNYFYKLDTYTPGDFGDITLTQLQTQTWTKCVIPNGAYLSVSDFLGAFAKLDDTIKFDILPGSRLKYVGTKPLMFPVTRDFTLEKFQSLNNLVINEDRFAVPSNVTGVTTPPTGSIGYSVYTTEVNGVQVPLNYTTPEFFTYSLIAKLGYNVQYQLGVNALQRQYFTYNMKKDRIPNTTNPDVVDWITGEGEQFLILFPGAEAGSVGNLLGPQAKISLVCDEIEKIGPYCAAFARLPIASVQPNCLFDLAPFTHQLHWYVLRSGVGGFNKLTIRLVDDYGNPYKLTIGPPSLQVLAAYRESMSSD